MIDDYYNGFCPYRGFYPRSNFRRFPYGNPVYANSSSHTNHTNNSIPDPKSQKTSNIDNSKKSEESSDPIFEIFGIKLFFDDLLLIALIFFLYSEGVKDQNLFIALILLLLS